MNNKAVFGKVFKYVLSFATLAFIGYVFLPAVSNASQNASAKPTAPLTVTYPNGGEFWTVGNWYRVEFKLNDFKLKGPYQIYLDKYNGSALSWSSLIGESPKTDYAYSDEFWYNVSSSLLTTPGAGSTFKIRVCSRYGNCKSDSSDSYFTVAS